MQQSARFTWKQLINYAIFGLAMAYLEAAVVVYLRFLYYPEGFHFPLKMLPAQTAMIEIGREFSTLVMLWFVARLLRGRFKEHLVAFIFTFGVWDLFYYFWLKVLLGWPGSWTEWDILFLIPVPWIAPWSAPALISVGFILVGILMALNPQKFDGPAFSKRVWLIEIIAALLILLTFFWQTASVLKGQLPDYYPWWLYWIAYVLGMGTFLKAYFHEPNPTTRNHSQPKG